MKVIVFGTGLFFENRKDMFQGVDIVAFLDNNEKMQGKQYEGVYIHKPDLALTIECDYIVIMSNRYEVEMIKQLLQLGVDDKKIISYAYFAQIVIEENSVSCMQMYYKRNYPYDKGRAKKILLVTHELTLSGAPMVLFYAAEILKKNGYDVVVVSPFEGPLKEKFLEEGIRVCVDDSINQDNQFIRVWAEEFDGVIVNTLVLGKLIDTLSGINTRVMWWLHESNTIYDKEFNRLKPKKIGNNIQIYCVGELAKGCFEQYFDGVPCKNLLYGLPDDNKGKVTGWSNKNGKIVFAVIGGLQKRKGQDIFVEAVSRLSMEEKNKAEFWIIGSSKLDSDFSTKIKSAARIEPSIVLIEEMQHQMLLENYKNIDVVVCPSTDDPMPVTATEAMSFYRTCMVSTGTGTASLITDGEDGFVFENNSQELADKMSKIIDNPLALEEMSIKSHMLYEKYFENSIFERNLLEIIDEFCVAE